MANDNADITFVNICHHIICLHHHIFPVAETVTLKQNNVLAEFQIPKSFGHGQSHPTYYPIGFFSKTRINLVVLTLKR